MTHSTYTVPAMREAANTLRADADKLEADAEAEARKHVEDAHRRAEQMRQGAAEIDADADAKLAEQQSADAAAASPPRVGDVDSCRGCGQPIAWDGLGWTHATPTQCTALTAFDQPAPAGSEATA